MRLGQPPPDIPRHWLCNRLSNVRPTTAGQDKVNRVNSDGETRRDFSRRPTFPCHCADLPYLFFGQPGPTVSCAASYQVWISASPVLISTVYGFWVFARSVLVASSRIETPLSLTVQSVVLHRSDKKVTGITARRIVAGVANKVRGGVLAVGEEIGHAMRSKGAPLCLERAVAIKQRTFPVPTLIKSANRNLRPEPTNITSIKPGEILRDSHIQIVHSLRGTRNLYAVQRGLIR